MNPYRWNCNKSFSHTHTDVCVCVFLSALCVVNTPQKHPAKNTKGAHRKEEEKNVERVIYDIRLLASTAATSSLCFFPGARRRLPRRLKKETKAVSAPPPARA
jgi:hypothetical protein